MDWESRLSKPSVGTATAPRPPEPFPTERELPGLSEDCCVGKRKKTLSYPGLRPLKCSYSGEGEGSLLWHKNCQRHRQSGCHREEDRIMGKAPLRCRWMGAEPKQQRTPLRPPAAQQKQSTAAAGGARGWKETPPEAQTQREGPQLGVETDKGLATQSSPAAQGRRRLETSGTEVTTVTKPTAAQRPHRQPRRTGGVNTLCVLHSLLQRLVAQGPHPAQDLFLHRLWAKVGSYILKSYLKRKQNRGIMCNGNHTWRSKLKVFNS